MPELASRPQEAPAPTLRAELTSIETQARSPETGPRPLVSRRHGRRDWLLRRLLALTDVASLTAALALALALLGGVRGHGWRELALYGLATLPAWVVLFKMYGLYERDAKRLHHSTLDDLPALFHALLLGGLLMWCYFVALAPARLSSQTVLAFGGLALVLVLAGRTLARAGLLRALSPERVLLIGSGDAGGPFIELMRARPRRFQPIGAVRCGDREEPAGAMPCLGSLKDVAELPACSKSIAWGASSSPTSRSSATCCCECCTSARRSR